MHLIGALLLMITIIGIPFAVACWKIIPLSLVPLGRRDRAAMDLRAGLRFH